METLQKVACTHRVFSRFGKYFDWLRAAYQTDCSPFGTAVLVAGGHHQHITVVSINTPAITTVEIRYALLATHEIVRPLLRHRSSVMGT